MSKSFDPKVSQNLYKGTGGDGRPMSGKSCCCEKGGRSLFVEDQTPSKKTVLEGSGGFGSANTWLGGPGKKNGCFSLKMTGRIQVTPTCRGWAMTVIKRRLTQERAAGFKEAKKKEKGGCLGETVVVFSKKKKDYFRIYSKGRGQRTKRGGENTKNRRRKRTANYRAEGRWKVSIPRGIQSVAGKG